MKPMIASYVPVSAGGRASEYFMERTKLLNFKTLDGYMPDEEQLRFGAPTHSTMAYSVGNIRVNNNEYYYPTPPGSAAPSSRQSIRDQRRLADIKNDGGDKIESEEGDYFPFPSPSNIDSPLLTNLSPRAISSKASTPTSLASTPTVKNTKTSKKEDEARNPAAIS